MRRVVMNKSSVPEHSETTSPPWTGQLNRTLRWMLLPEHQQRPCRRMTSSLA
jgi:hypothetical protein